MNDQPSSVICIGGAIIDVIAHVEDSFLAAHKIAKGGSTVVDQVRLDTVLDNLPGAEYLAGGCAANTACNLSTLGVSSAFVGKVGHDVNAELFKDGFDKYDVNYTPVYDEDKDTALLICLVTPDKDRSFVYTMDNARWALTLDDMPSQTPRMVYMESNLVDIKSSGSYDSFLEDLLEGRKFRGAVSVLNLNDENLMKKRKDKIISCLPHIEIILGNRDEFLQLFDSRTIKDLAKLTENEEQTFVITDHDRPVTVLHHGIVDTVSVPEMTSNEIVDSIGAGDGFAAGFIAAFLKSDPLHICVQSGIDQAQKVLRVKGGRP